jgi:DNA-binding transcriptional LysR family regulator
MPINEMRAITMLAKAVELGSIRRAAVAQGVSSQAASQALAQLEQHLGVRLLHRTTRSLALTEEGQFLLQTAQPALSILERALAQVREGKDEIAGPLRIVGPKSSFAPILMPVIDEFCRLHPDVQPDIQLEDGIGNWVLDRVDVGFRLGAPPEDGLIARKLFPAQLIICAAPSYLQRNGVPRSLEDLARHRCTVFRHPSTGQVIPWYVRVKGEIVRREFAPALSTNDTELEILAVLAGQAIGQLASMSVANLVRSSKLIPVLIDQTMDHRGVYIYYGNRKSQPRRVRAFIDLATSRLSESHAFVLSDKELSQNAKRGVASLGKKASWK